MNHTQQEQHNTRRTLRLQSVAESLFRAIEDLTLEFTQFHASVIDDTFTEVRHLEWLFNSVEACIKDGLCDEQTWNQSLVGQLRSHLYHMDCHKMSPREVAMQLIVQKYGTLARVIASCPP